MVWRVTRKRDPKPAEIYLAQNSDAAKIGKFLSAGCRCDRHGADQPVKPAISNLHPRAAAAISDSSPWAGQGFPGRCGATTGRNFDTKPQRSIEPLVATIFHSVDRGNSSPVAIGGFKDGRSR